MRVIEARRSKITGVAAQSQDPDLGESDGNRCNFSWCEADGVFKTEIEVPEFAKAEEGRYIDIRARVPFQGLFNDCRNYSFGVKREF